VSRGNPSWHASGEQKCGTRHRKCDERKVNDDHEIGEGAIEHLLWLRGCKLNSIRITIVVVSSLKCTGDAGDMEKVVVMATQKFDLVLFGASGFTGTQTLKHLVQHVPKHFKWAIGGRNKEKLEALLPLCNDAASQPSIVLADSADAKSVGKLVASTSVIIQLAGPYAAHGEHFVASAAKHGAHYLDLTGEIGWVKSMIERYHDVAVESKAKIVPVAGFEALPFDIAALYVAQKLLDETGERAVKIEIVNRFTGPPAFRPRDILSGGTMATIKGMLEGGDASALNDPAVLVMDQKIAQSIRDEHPYDFSTRYNADENAWLAPTVPAPFVNPPVVYRTISLLARAKNSPFAAGCEYIEGLSTKPFAPFSIAQRVIAESLALSFKAMTRSIARNGRLDQMGRTAAKQFFDWVGPTSGQGPSEKHLEETGYSLRVRATSASGASVAIRAKANGHPGYKSTAMLVAEAGLLLAGEGAEGCSALPKRYGVITPASAFGTSATAAWERAELVLDMSIKT
jgi:short subunit dehydrogenase-like uncharacterized protein